MTTLPQSTSTTSIQLPRPGMHGAGTRALAPAGLMGGPMPLSGQGQMTGADVWRVIRTNVWLILGSIIFSAIFGLGLNWFLKKNFARYTATGFVKIESGRRLPGEAGRIGESGFAETDTLIVEQRTQAQILHHDSLFQEVLSNLNSEIRKTAWFEEFRKSDGTPDVPEAIDDLLEKFSAVPITDSKLIAVSMTYKDPKDAQTIVMNVVNQHLENMRKLNADRTYEKTQYYTMRKNSLERRVKELRDTISGDEAFLTLAGVGNGSGRLSVKDAELLKLVEKRLEVESEADVTKAALEAARQTVAQGGTPAAVELMVSQHPQVLKWRSNVDEMDVRIRSSSIGVDNPMYQRMMSEREVMQQKLDEVTQEERLKSTIAYMETLQSRAASAQTDLEKLNAQIDKVKEDLAEVASRLASYLSNKDEILGYQELARRDRDQLDQLNLAKDFLDMNTVSWMRQPVRPEIPSFPKLPVTLAACVALGLGLSLGIAFLREIMDTTVRSPRDIARVGQMTFLGMIPHEDDDPQTAGVPLPTVIYGAPGSMMAEQFRQVRTRLQHAASLDTTRSMLVTSPSPDDGKSTVACNLAAGLALNGRRILLVDANFRRAELHKIFGVGNEVGFGNVLNSVENFESAVRQTRVPNLDIMTTGPKPANATELLESQLLVDFIERALEEYDHVIFDSGPMLFVSETVALAPRVDGVITVVRASTNTRGLLQRMRDQLRQLRAEHLGVVLNAVKATGGGYYGRNIKTYYEYQNGHAE